MRRRPWWSQTEVPSIKALSRRTATLLASSDLFSSEIQWPIPQEEEGEAEEQEQEAQQSITSRQRLLSYDMPHLQTPSAHHHRFLQKETVDRSSSIPFQTTFSVTTKCSTKDIAISAPVNPGEREIEDLCGKGFIDVAFTRLDELRDPPCHETLVILIRACRKLGSPSHARHIHIFLLRHQISLQGCLGEHLISTLAKCGNFQDACTVLHGLSQRTSLSWSSLISSFVEHKRPQEALSMYARMLNDGAMAKGHTFVYLFKACGDIPDPEQGRKYHAVAHVSGISASIFVGNVLIGMYRKFGNIIEVEEVFIAMQERDLVSWNSMLSAYLGQGEGEKGLLLYRQMRLEGWNPHPQTFVMTLQACALVAEKDENDPSQWQHERCKYLSIVQALHAEAKRFGFSAHPFVGTTLVTTYGKCGAIHEAEHVSGSLSEQDVVSWTAMFSAYARDGQGIKALQVYRKMLEEGMDPDPKAFAIAIQACEPLAQEEVCTKVLAIEIVQALHEDAWKKGFVSDPILSSLLVYLYCKCGTVKDAEDMFCLLLYRDLTVWTAMMSAYAGGGEGEKAIKLYRQMLAEGIVPDSQAFATVLQACGTIAVDEDVSHLEGRSIKKRPYHILQGLHADAQRKGLASDSLVTAMLISTYSKCGAIAEAEDVFLAVSGPDAQEWLKILTTHLEQGKAERTLLWFKHMQETGTQPNSQTILVGIQACGLLALAEEPIAVEGRFMKVRSMEFGQALLADVKRQGYDSDIFVATALVNILGKCGCIEDAESICAAFCKPDVVLCTAMLSVYIEQGQAEKALDLYTQMQDDGILISDDVIVVCVLQACGKTGNLELTRHSHFAISFSGLCVRGFLASVLAYAYGNCAGVRDLQAIFDVLLDPDLVTINACIAGHAGEGNLFACEQMAQEVQSVGLNFDGITFVSLVSACSHVGLVNRGLEFVESLIRDHHLTLDLKHYSTLLDLLGRAGDFSKIDNLLRVSQFRADSASWLCLLGACRIHGNAIMARRAFDAAVSMQPCEAAPYILMSRIYVEAGLDDLAAEVEKLKPQVLKDAMTWPELD